MFQSQYMSTIHLTDAQIGELFESMDQLARHDDTRDDDEIERRGKDVRLSFRHRDIGMIAEHPGGGQGAYLIYTRNLTPNGVAFVHGGYLHKGTRCRFMLPTIWGGEEAVRGAVIWSRLVSGTIHEIAVRFDKPIELWRYIESDESSAQEVAKSINLDALVGEALLIDDLEVECRICEHHLSGTKLEVASVASLAEAMEEITSKSFDVVLCDMNLGDTRGEDAIKTIRKAPFLGPIIALTGETAPARMRSIKEAGADAVVKKPYEPQNLLAVLAEWLTKGGEGGGNGPMYSQLAADPNTEPLVKAYFEFVEQTIQAMKKAIADDDLATTRRCCQDIRETGGGYGFPGISDAAERAVQSLDATCSIAESLSDVQKLEATTKLMREGAPPS